VEGLRDRGNWGLEYLVLISKNLRSIFYRRENPQGKFNVLGENPQIYCLCNQPVFPRTLLEDLTDEILSVLKIYPYLISWDGTDSMKDVYAN
jgi:hypothetical protein